MKLRKQVKLLKKKINDIESKLHQLDIETVKHRHMDTYLYDED